MSSSGSRRSPSSVSRFCDYFVIFGLDENSGLEVLQSYEGDPSADFSNWTPLERSYKPKILAHYPENVAWSTFDHDAVRSLSLPSGLIFRTQKHGLDPSFHSFVITRENGSRTYGCSQVFYEEVKSKHVISAIQTLQAMHLTELSSAKTYHERRATQSRNIRNNGGILQSNQRNLQRKNQLPNTDDTNTRSLPRHFKIGGGKGSSLAYIQNFYDATKDRLYVTKGIALISHLPFVHAPKLFLSRLHNLWESGTGNLSLESHVHNLLYEVPLPPPGRSVQYNCVGETIILSRPGAAELPLLDYFLGDLFKLLDPHSLIQLFTCLLLENQILLYSKDLYRLMVVSECVTVLLFPFLWQHVYVPILPSTLFHFLDAPVPYIMGLHAQTTECGESLPAEGNLCFVDIDRNQIQIPEDTPIFPQKNELIQEMLSLLKEHKMHVRKSNKSQSNVCGSLRRRRMGGRKASHGSSADSDSGMSSNEESISLNGSSGNILSMTQSIHSQLPLPYSYQSTHNQDGDVELEDGTGEENFLRNLKINNGIREIFFNRFVHMFSTYDHFVVTPDQDPTRMVVHNFDKATFLSDQPDDNLPFLSRFLETQMFASLIDRKIASLSGENDVNLSLFEQRIKILRNKFGESLVRTPVYEPCPSTRETEEVIEKRFLNRDFVVPLPKELNSEEETIPSETPLGSFPILSKKLLNMLPPQSRSRRIFNELSACDFALSSDTSMAPVVGEYPSLRSVFVPSETNSSPASIAQANWEFVKQLLHECKNKTKRMLVGKLGGEEAVALGHGGDCVLGLEEKTLVASLCDLLERIWAHGLHVKQKGKSPLWNFLMNYEETEAAKDTNKAIDPQFLSPDLSARAMELNLPVSPYKTEASNTPPDSPRKHASRSRDKTMDPPVLKPLPSSIATDIRNIQGITEIRTEIGYARAWIRLSLEKKVLSKHLRCLLSDDELLRGFYKRTAFLRSEEEREQFLYHLLTLNAVDYFSFTNTYTNILLPYRVMIFPSRRQRSNANLWVILSGTLGETGIIHIPRNSLEHAFIHKNIGRLRSLRIGHDSSGVSQRILIDYVITRNEVTGHTKKFPCGRWLGRDVDDGSTERLLVGEAMEVNEEENARPKTPPRVRSPSVPRRFYESRLSVRDIQKALVESVDRIMKYYSIGEKNKGSLTVLLCGEFGLVASLEHVFQYGFKSSRLFTRNFYIWDYLLKVKEYFEGELEAEIPVLDNLGEEEYFPEQVETVKAYVELIQKIQSVGHGLGKDGKLQLFVCLSAREHLLHRLPVHLSSCPATMEMFETDSFLRDPHLLSDLIQTLEPLDDLDIQLEQSLSKGIE